MVYDYTWMRYQVYTYLSGFEFIVADAHRFEQNNVTKSRPEERGEADVQHRMDTYNTRITADKDAHPHPLRQPRKSKLVSRQRKEDFVHPGLNISNSPVDSSGQPRKFTPVVGQQKEDLAHSGLNAVDASLDTDTPENRNLTVQPDDESPSRDKDSLLSVVLEGGKNGLTWLDPSGQPRKSKSVDGQEGGFVHPDLAVPTVPTNVGNPENRRLTVMLGDKTAGKNRNNPLSAAPGGVQSSSIRLSSSGQPRKLKSVAGQPEEDQYPNGSENHQSSVASESVQGGSERLSPNKLTEDRERAKVVAVYIPNIVVIGETGAGKSSIINLIADQKLAHTSNSALGCTFQHERYQVTLGKMSCALWDTTGLDEGSEGTVPLKQAECNLKELIQQLARSGGIHLVIYCIRGTRLTVALRRNYDLFYAAVCQKKVHIALVVTGLEHQQGEMETWWTENEMALRRHGMQFDAHACVTTLDVKDHLIQQRRLASRTLLRDLVVTYSGLPAWKPNSSLLPRVLPVFHNILRGKSATDAGPGNTTTTRKVTVCVSFPNSLPGTPAVWNKSTAKIGYRKYEFLQVDKHALNTVTSKMLEEVGGIGTGLLIFYTSALADKRISLSDVDALKRFYDIAGGHMCPMIVAVWGCDDDEIAQACRLEVTSRYSDVQAYFVPFTSTDDARAELHELIESLCIEQVAAVKKPWFFQRYLPHKR